MSAIMEVVEVVHLYNPLLTDFSYPWLDDQNQEHILTIPSLQIVEFPKAQGEFLLKHLIDAIDIDRGGNLSPDIRREKIRNEVVK